MTVFSKKSFQKELTIRAQRDVVDERRIVLERGELLEASAVYDVNLGKERDGEEGRDGRELSPFSLRSFNAVSSCSL